MQLNFAPREHHAADSDPLLNTAYVSHLARHDRRMFVLKVSPKHAEDRAFWSQFRATYKAELGAFMHDLWKRD